MYKKIVTANNLFKRGWTDDTDCKLNKLENPGCSFTKEVWGYINQWFNLSILDSGHSQCKTLSQSPRQLNTSYLWYFADVTAYLLKKEVEKIRFQVLFGL